MYLITLRKREAQAIDYMLIDNWDSKKALLEFYSKHPFHKFTCDLFETIINKLDIDRAVELHNTLAPGYYIDGIYAVDDRPVFKEKAEGQSDES